MKAVYRSLLMGASIGWTLVAGFLGSESAGLAAIASALIALNLRSLGTQFEALELADKLEEQGR